MERTLWAGHARAARARRPGPARRGAGADVLQLGDAPGVQHGGRGLGHRVSRPRRPPRPSPPAPPAVRPRPGGRGRRRRWSAASSSGFPGRCRTRPSARRGDRGAADQRGRSTACRPAGPIEVDVLRPVFYRNKGAYVVGRVRRGGVVLPLVLPLLRAERGIVVDAVLMTPERGQRRVRLQLVLLPGRRAPAARAGRVPPLHHAAQARRRALQRHRLQQARQDRAVPQPDGATWTTPTRASPSPRATRAW